MPVKRKRQNKKGQAQQANSNTAVMICSGDASAITAHRQPEISDKGKELIKQDNQQQQQQQYDDENDWKDVAQLLDEASVTAVATATAKDQQQHENNNEMDIDIEEEADNFIEGMQELEGEQLKQLDALVLNDSSLWLSLPPPLPWSTTGAATIGFDIDGDLYGEDVETTYGQLVGEGIMISPVEAAAVVSVKSTPSSALMNFHNTTDSDSICRQCSIVSTTSSDYSSSTTTSSLSSLSSSSAHSSRCSSPILCDQTLEEMGELIDDCLSTTDFAKEIPLPKSMSSNSLSIDLMSCSSPSTDSAMSAIEMAAAVVAAATSSSCSNTTGNFDDILAVSSTSSTATQQLCDHNNWSVLQKQKGEKGQQKSEESSSSSTVTMKTTTAEAADNRKGAETAAGSNNKRKANLLLSSSSEISNGEQQNVAVKKQKNKGSRKYSYLQPEVVEYLRSWMMSPEHVEHPYPTDQEKRKIMDDTGLELKQLMNWFVNNRKRYWKPRVEESKKKKEQQEAAAAALLAQQQPAAQTLQLQQQQPVVAAM